MLACMRFVHTADWQIGKPFRAFAERESLLHKARLDAIERLGQLAIAQGAAHILIAGDLYDSEQPSVRTLREPIQRMRRFPGITWHVIPGNHDPHRNGGPWDRLQRDSVPDSVRLHLEPAPVAIGSEAVLLPSVLRRRSDTADLTQWMDDAPSSPGVIRIGLAHGSVTGFGGESEAGNPIAPDRAKKAGLDYLALGDWHRTLEISPSTWYAGTPEPDRFGSQETGQALLVDIAAAGAPPTVSTMRTGSFTWLKREEHLGSESDIAAVVARLQAEGDGHTILRLKLSGALSVSARTMLTDALARLEAALAHLDADLTALAVRPTEADLEAIDFGGVLREAAERLKAMAQDEALGQDQRRHASDALVELYLLAASHGAESSAECAA